MGEYEILVKGKPESNGKLRANSLLLMIKLLLSIWHRFKMNEEKIITTMCFVTGFRCSLCRRRCLLRWWCYLIECFVAWLETCNRLCTSWSLTLGPIPTWVEVRAGQEKHKEAAAAQDYRPVTFPCPQVHTAPAAVRPLFEPTQQQLFCSPPPPLLLLPTSHPWPPNFSLPTSVCLYLQPCHQQKSGATEPRCLRQRAESSPQAPQTKETWQFILSTMTTQQLTTNANLLCVMTSRSWGCSIQSYGPTWTWLSAYVEADTDS